jgi:LPS-assembly lipoprotein
MLNRLFASVNYSGMRTSGAIRLFALTAVLVSLAGCGYEPLLARGRGTDVQAELSQIRIQPIPDRSGQLLGQRLGELMSVHQSSGGNQYTLQVQLREPRQVLALRRDDVISRGSYSISAQFVLRDNSGGRLTGGTTFFATDYEITNSEFATRISLDSARERLIDMVGSDIVRQLADHFNDTATPRR